MKNMILPTLLTVALLVANGHAYADAQQDFEAGKNADSAEQYNKAAELYLKAAEQGFAPAQYKLGVMYDKGHGFTRNVKQAESWYIRAATQGYADAQYNLGALYINDMHDYKQATLWLRKAAEQGDVGAQHALHNLYMEEYGD